jgi:hypothetical protein
MGRLIISNGTAKEFFHMDVHILATQWTCGGAKCNQKTHHEWWAYLVSDTDDTGFKPITYLWSNGVMAAQFPSQTHSFSSWCSEASRHTWPCTPELLHPSTPACRFACHRYIKGTTSASAIPHHLCHSQTPQPCLVAVGTFSPLTDSDVAASLFRRHGRFTRHATICHRTCAC